MSDSVQLYADWNPWHGCTKLSAGCKYCYVYRQDAMYGSALPSRLCRKTKAFDAPIRRKRDGSYRIPAGKVIMTCFTSDFLLEDADVWRADCWRMMKQRPDCWFYFFTKRIDRLAQCLPPDWKDGYDNVLIGCTVENQDRADYRLPILRDLPIKHKSIIVSPLLEAVDISAYLDDSIEEVSVGGESGECARMCNYDWVLDIRAQCIAHDVPFRFHQTGAHFVKDGKQYRIRRRDQIAQAHKAGINYRIKRYFMPETAEYRPPEPDETQQLMLDI